MRGMLAKHIGGGGGGTVVVVVKRREFESLLGNLGEMVGEIRRRLRACAYSGVGLRSPSPTSTRAAGPDFAKLFHYYDRDNSCELSYEEFRRCVRKDGRVTARAVTERQLRLLFDMLDLDTSGFLELNEWMKFLDPTAAATTNRSPSPLAHSSRMKTSPASDNQASDNQAGRPESSVYRLSRTGSMGPTLFSSPRPHRSPPLPQQPSYAQVGATLQPFLQLGFACTSYGGRSGRR